MTTASHAPKDPLAEAEDLYSQAAELAGPRLTTLAAELGKDYINERDHLQPTYKTALEQVAGTATPSLAVSPTLGHGLKDSWPGLGRFDISLSWGSRATVFGELKCDSESLTACAWDALKGAFALLHGVGHGMLLVAAAPKMLWERRALGVELLAGGEWEASDIRRRHHNGFKKWERDGYKPVRVPAHVRTVEASRSEFPIAGKPWLLGVARVEPVGDDWWDWPPLLAEGEDAVGHH